MRQTVEGRDRSRPAGRRNRARPHRAGLQQRHRHAAAGHAPGAGKPARHRSASCVEARRGRLSSQRPAGGWRDHRGPCTASSSMPLAQIFGLDPANGQAATSWRTCLQAGKANGEALPGQEAEPRAPALYGGARRQGKNFVDHGAGEHLSGRPPMEASLSDRQYQAVLQASKSRISYIDLTFSAPKSVSIAWAFAPTTAERAIIHQAHTGRDRQRHACHRKADRPRVEGRFRKGMVTSRARSAGSPSIIMPRGRPSRSYAPTSLVIRYRVASRSPARRDVSPVTCRSTPMSPCRTLWKRRAAGVGSLDFAELEGRIHEWGALYQAHLASNLRIHGVEVETRSAHGDGAGRRQFRTM